MRVSVRVRVRVKVRDLFEDVGRLLEDVPRQSASEWVSECEVSE